MYECTEPSQIKLNQDLIKSDPIISHYKQIEWKHIIIDMNQIII